MKLLFLISCALCAAVCVHGQAMKPRDAQFLADAAQASLLEIKLGELTITRAKSDSVKVLGRQIVIDHTKTLEDLKALAVAKNVTLPDSLSDKGKTCYRQLAALSGTEFDKAYAQHMVDHHKKDVALYKEEKIKGSDDDVHSWVMLKLPILEHHLMSSQVLDADLADLDKK